MNISETIVTCCNGTGTKTFQMGCAECPAAKWNAFIGGGKCFFPMFNQHGLCVCEKSN